MWTREQFLKCLRDTLNHLYDPDRLRHSPLLTLFGIADRFDAPASLRRILIEAIESLKPRADEPAHAPSRRMYDLLLYRYVQQFSQQEVANQLGLSVRHLRREQAVALEALACLLWEQYHLEDKVGDAAGSAPTADAPMYDELAWLKGAAGQFADLEQTLAAVLELVRPLAVQHQVSLETSLAGSFPRLAVHPVALRQSLINLIGVAIHRAACESVVISARPRQWEVEIQVLCCPASSLTAGALSDEKASLDIVHRMATLCGGRLALSEDNGAFAATLALPALELLPVLVIDDNVDTLQLLQRYASGTRYRLLGVQDPDQAIALAEKVAPQVIVLDVMMPQIDGWEVLGRLRQHPATAHSPVIICTILAQEELALSLGASAFLRKPVTRQAFLDALDRQVKGSESR